MERRKRRAARPAVGQVLTIGTALSVGLAFALGATGCGGGSGQKQAEAQKSTATAGESDTTIYRAANALPDAAAKLAALQEFLKKHPQSALRGAAHRNVFLMTKEAQGAEAAMAYAKQVLATEKLPAARGMMHYVLYSEATDPAGVAAVIEGLKADPNTDELPWNAIAWDMQEKGENLSLALELAATGVARATDPMAKAGVLDTQGWVAYRMGDYASAANLLKQAVDQVPDAGDAMAEIRGRLAMAYDKAGMKREARDLYADMLVNAVDPDMKARVIALSTELDGSADAAMKQIQEKRALQAKDAPNFTLKTYDGQPVSLADYRGKVVMLNFWHPT